MEIKISAEQLYILGGLMHARYIDYAYIAAMDDVDRRFNIIYKDCLADLSSLGVISEDFSGNIEILPEYAALLEPIFFGEKESSLDVCSFGDRLNVRVYKFHFLDNRITMVTGIDKKLLICDVDEESLMSFVSGLLPEQNQSCTEKTDVIFDRDKLSRLFVIKFADVGKQTSDIVRYAEIDGTVFSEAAGGSPTSVKSGDFTSGVYKLLRGEKYGV